jgi:predicted ATPase
MLEFIRIQRFKSLSDASFPLAPLNLFSGLNGMGKSSLIQALLLLRQSFEKNALLSKGLLLKGEYVNLGTGQDILSEHADIANIEFILTWSEHTPYVFKFQYSAKSDLQPIENDAAGFIHPEFYSLFNKNFQYLSADRISPKSTYDASDYYIKDMNSLGNHGEYTAHYVAEYGLRPITIAAFQHNKANSLNLLDNIDKWMAEISPGIRIHANLQNALNTVSLSYVYEQGNEYTADFKPQNVGFGLTFVLPVIVAILRSKPGDMLIIENPEAHLHPGGQTIIGKLCAIAANNGVQLIIESHSDHFLNGIRVSVRENLVQSDHVHLFFLERNAQNLHSSSIISPTIDRNGRLNKWPKGFFDEGDRQLEKLL